MRQAIEQDWIELRDKPLEVQSSIGFVMAPSAGGISIFLGTTRAEAPDARQLIALDYEAYSEMALPQLRDLAKRARAKWPIVSLALHHRTGRVEIGQPSVLIAVSTPHRAEAFDACRWLIDTLKAEVTIWKKEVWAEEMLNAD